MGEGGIGGSRGSGVGRVGEEVVHCLVLLGHLIFVSYTFNPLSCYASSVSLCNGFSTRTAPKVCPHC